jgi:hypothetical protein
MRKFLTLAILTLNIVLHAAAPVTLRLARTPRFQFAPGYAILQASIEPDARNREYCITYEGGYSGQRCRELEGSSAPRTQEPLELRDLPGGEYVANVVVARDNGSVITSGTVQWTICAVGESCGGPEIP